jgi:ABC-type nickel/cobalt efflux system permease component RcnA
MDYSLTAVLGVGFLMGIRHAMEPDHVAAVSTFVSQQRSVLRSCLLGTFWGIGHTSALLIASLAVITFKVTIPPQVEKAIETVVALVLILLGGHVLLRSLSGVHLHQHEHSHDGDSHSHVHVHVGAQDAHGHIHLLRMGRWPLLVGVLHGLAGSAALMLLIVATIPSPVAALFYVLVFGIGSTGGMLALSGLIGLPFVATAGRSRMAHVAIQAVAGGVSMIIGVIALWSLRGT